MELINFFLSLFLLFFFLYSFVFITFSSSHVYQKNYPPTLRETGQPCTPYIEEMSSVALYESHLLTV